MKKTYIIFAFIILNLFNNGCLTSTRNGRTQSPKFMLNTEPKKVTLTVSYFDVNGESTSPIPTTRSFVTVPDMRLFSHESNAIGTYGAPPRINQVVINKEGYFPKTLRKDDLILSKKYTRGYGARCYTYPHKIILEKNPGFQGSDKDLPRLQVTINTEPSGASVYAEGKKMGVTPCSISFDLMPTNFQRGRLQSTPIVIAKEGYLAKEKTLILEVNPEWKYYGGEVAQRTFDLTVLNPDPNYRPRPIANNTYHVQSQPNHQNAASEVTVINKDGNKVRDFANTVSALDYLIQMAR